MDDHRIYQKKVSIETERVKDFFNNRAGMIGEKGLGAVLLGDQNPSIAENIDRYEQEIILPKLDINRNTSVLDLGCGMGRWARIVLPYCGRYRGSDFSEKLIEKARDVCKDYSNAEFRTLSVPETIEYEAQMNEKYDRVILSGVLMYINDQDLQRVFAKLPDITQENCIIYIRDTVATQERLTLSDFPSKALQSEYSSIYRTQEEYRSFFKPLLSAGFALEEEDYCPIELGRAQGETNSMYTILSRNRTK